MPGSGVSARQAFHPGTIAGIRDGCRFEALARLLGSFCAEVAATHRFGIVRWGDALTVEEESDTLRRLALALAESIHELLELSSPLDLEEDFVVVVCHLNVEVLALRVVLLRRAVVRHFYWS